MSAHTPEYLLSELLDHDSDHDSDHARACFQELETMLEESEDARLRYLAYVDLHNILDLELNVEPIMLGHSKVVPIDRILHNQKVKIFRWAAGIAAVFIVASWIGLSVLYPDAPQPILTFQTSPGTEFTMTHDLPNSEDAVEGQQLRDGSRLQISQGVVELQFDSGVRAVISGPADITMQHKDRLYMHHGTGWFHVPEGAEGFEVLTRHTKIVDLGTDFGVVASSKYYDEVHVFKGAVEINARSGHTKKYRLEAGSARMMKPQGHHALDPTPEIFLTQLPENQLYLHWSFDEHDRGKLVTEGTHPIAKTIQSSLHQKESSEPSQRFVPGRFNRGLRFNGKGDSIITNWPGISMNAPRTTAFWVRLPEETTQYDVGVVAWGMRQPGREVNNTKWNVQIARKRGPKSKEMIINCSLGGLWFEGNTPVNDQQWHHVCVTYSGGLTPKGKPDIQLYLDGEPEKGNWRHNSPLDITNKQEIRVHTETHHPDAIPLMMGSTIHENKKSRHYFKGELDEVYVFFNKLELSDIQQLYQNNSLPPSKP